VDLYLKDLGVVILEHGGRYITRKGADLICTARVQYSMLAWRREHRVGVLTSLLGI
jgi:hypothetical protein